MFVFPIIFDKIIFDWELQQNFVVIAQVLRWKNGSRPRLPPTQNEHAFKTYGKLLLAVPEEMGRADFERP